MDPIIDWWRAGRDGVGEERDLCQRTVRFLTLARTSFQTPPLDVIRDLLKYEKHGENRENILFFLIQISMFKTVWKGVKTSDINFAIYRSNWT